MTNRPVLPELNTVLTMVLADLHRRSAAATLVLKSPSSMRRIHVGEGHLLSAESNVVAERLGDMLASEGLLDPVLIEPVATEARRRGTLLGSQLITDGLLPPAEVAAALERQVRCRFEAAIGTPGVVSIEEAAPVPKVIKTPLGAAIVLAFRERLGLAALEQFIADRDSTPVALKLDAVSALQLMPAELMVCHRLAAGETLEVLLEGSAREQVTRTVAALVGLGLWA
ncbi:MAG: hypothetical protein H6Q89_5311 [Myxococcaceae bacterium]|nr:hypothetical protein [Myxococcaceae bacterium]